MPLINFYQLKKMSEALQSYDAEKVQTKVQKPANAGNYNVEELFGKTADDIMSVNSRLNEFKAKKVRDVVRLELQLVDGKAQIPADLETRVPGIDKTQLLPAYTLDNALVLDENGARLTVDLRTGLLSGTPSVVDAEASAKAEDGKLAYKQIFVTSIKVFPVGEWTLESFPSEALLDNDEMQLVAYRSAVDQIVVELAKDQNLFAAIQKQIGSRAVEDALAEKAFLTDVYSVGGDGTKIPLYRQMIDKIKRGDVDESIENVLKGEERLEDEMDAAQKDIETLQASYDADKVLTLDDKEDGSKRNVNETFAAVRSELAQEANRAEGKESELMTRISGIYEKPILRRQMVLVERLDKEGFDAAWKKEYQQGTLPVYGWDGKLQDEKELFRLVDESHEPLTVAFSEDSTLSGKAYAVDMAELKKTGSVYYEEYDVSKGAYIFPEESTEFLPMSDVTTEQPVARLLSGKEPRVETSFRVPKEIGAWKPGTEYLSDDFASFEGRKYICKKRHVSGDKFPPERNQWIELSDHQTVFSYAPDVSQSEYDGVQAKADAPVPYLIPVKENQDLCRRGIEVLSRGTAKRMNIVNNCVQAESSKYEYNKDTVEITTSMHPRVSISDNAEYSTVSGRYIAESDIIDLDAYTVAAFSITEKKKA